MNFKILAFSGSIGSGKSTLSMELAGKLNYKYASFGRYVRELAVSIGYVKPHRAQLQEIGKMLVENDAKSFCLSVLQSAGWTLGEGLIIDGIRHLSIFELLGDICYPQELLLIYITVDEKTRMKRVIARGKDKELISIMNHSTETDVHQILKSKADLIVDGEESIERNIQNIITWLARFD